MHNILFFSVSERNPNQELTLNVLGTLHETKHLDTKNAIYHIEYMKQKEYIWSRRKNLNGAKLRIGYIDSGYHLYTVDNKNQAITKDELVDGKLVSVIILEYLYLVSCQKIHDKRENNIIPSVFYFFRF